MKTILKFKSLFAVLAFLTIAMSSINATSLGGVSTCGIGEYEEMILPIICPKCKGNKWLVAEDGTGSVYHVLCPNCGHEFFPGE